MFRLLVDVSDATKREMCVTGVCVCMWSTWLCCSEGRQGILQIVVTVGDQVTLFLAHHNAIMLLSSLPNTLSVTRYYSQTYLKALHVSILSYVMDIFRSVGSLLSSIGLKKQRQRGRHPLSDTVPTGSQICHTCGEELLCCSLFEICSKPSHSPLRGPPALLQSDFTPFRTLIPRQNSAPSSPQIIEREVQFHGPWAKLLPETRVMMEAYLAAKGGLNFWQACNYSTYNYIQPLGCLMDETSGVCGTNK